MSKIKVGQIYRYTTHTNLVFVITQSYDDNTRFDYIDNNGVTSGYICEHDVLYKTELIAEYPTWQEAVNSKEFNDVAED